MLSLLLALAIQASPCTADRPAMLALSEQAFDQDMAGGWRPLADRRCFAEAADLIRDWRAAHPKAVSRPWLSFWHEGQARALAGQNAAAIALFDRARRPASEDKLGWNLYVDGTVTFLKHDRAGLDAAFARLAALPGSANAEVLDGFRRCWGRSYNDAYPCPLPTDDTDRFGRSAPGLPPAE